MRNLVSLLIVAAVCGSVFGADFWNGGTSDWSTPSNWNLGVLPHSTEHVQICRYAYTNAPVFGVEDGPYDIGTLALGWHASDSLLGSTDFYITGGVFNANGQVHIGTQIGGGAPNAPWINNIHVSGGTVFGSGTQMGDYEGESIGNLYLSGDAVYLCGWLTLRNTLGNIDVTGDAQFIIDDSLYGGNFEQSLRDWDASITLQLLLII